MSELQQIATMYGFLNKGILIEEISAHELQEKCSDCIEIILSDVEKYAVLMEKNFPKETYKVLPENHIRIYKPGFQAKPTVSLPLKTAFILPGCRHYRHLWRTIIWS